jgi:hypothetical protein
VAEEAIAERSKAIAALQEAWRERHIERRRTVQRITSLLLRQTWSDAHLETLGGLLQQIMNREAARALRRALKPPSNEEMAAAP